MPTQPHYKLTYFDARAVAEPIRLIFAYAGVEYEDVRLPLSKFTDEFREEIKKKYGSLPILEIDGVPYSQAAAITSYLGKKYGLGGSDEFEEFRLDESFHELREYFMKWGPLFYESTPNDKKDELRTRLLGVDTPKVMSKYNGVLVKNKEAGSPWLIGKKMTWGDICLAHFISNLDMSIANVNLIKGYSALEDHQKLVFDQPGIKEWIARRPDTMY